MFSQGATRIPSRPFIRRSRCRVTRRPRGSAPRSCERQLLFGISLCTPPLVGCRTDYVRVSLRRACRRWHASSRCWRNRRSRCTCTQCHDSQRIRRLVPARSWVSRKRPGRVQHECPFGLTSQLRRPISDRGSRRRRRDATGSRSRTPISSLRRAPLGGGPGDDSRRCRIVATSLSTPTTASPGGASRRTDVSTSSAG
jgi:hypothetical protein